MRWRRFLRKEYLLFLCLFPATVISLLFGLTHGQNLVLKTAASLGARVDSLPMERVAVYVDYSAATTEDPESFTVAQVDRFFPRSGPPLYDDANFPFWIQSREVMLNHLAAQSGKAAIYLDGGTREALGIAGVGTIQRLPLQDSELKFRYLAGCLGLQIVEENFFINGLMLVLGVGLGLGFLAGLCKNKIHPQLSKKRILGLVALTVGAGLIYRWTGALYPETVQLERPGYELVRPGNPG